MDPIALRLQGDKIARSALLPARVIEVTLSFWRGEAPIESINSVNLIPNT